MSEEEKFDLDGDIIMQIEMDSYMKYNDTIASMNDHLGEIYGYSDVRDTEEAQLKYEKELAYKAIVQLQQKVEEKDKEIDRLNNIINRIDSFVDRTITVIKQQPSGNDEWILERLNGIKYLTELKENNK